MARYARSGRDPKVTLVRAHSYLTDNAIIDDYGPKIGAYGVAVYHALNRFADRQTGVCWPKIKTIGARLRLSESSVKRALLILKSVGVITIDPRWSEDGDRTSNLFTLIPLATVAERTQSTPIVADAPAEPVPDGGGGVTQNPPPMSPERTVGSPGTSSEQSPPLNKNTSPFCSEEKNTQHHHACSHPAPEVSHFAEMSICHHCWTILPDHGATATPLDTEHSVVDEASTRAA